MSKTKTTLTFALAAAFGAAGMAHAAGNPFAVQSLDRGYMVAAAGEKAAEAKCGEGKCGGKNESTKPAPATADAEDAKDAKDAKVKEAKCGEGKCGGKK